MWTETVPATILNVAIRNSGREIKEQQRTTLSSQITSSTSMGRKMESTPLYDSIRHSRKHTRPTSETKISMTRMTGTITIQYLTTNNFYYANGLNQNIKIPNQLLPSKPPIPLPRHASRIGN